MPELPFTPCVIKSKQFVPAYPLTIEKDTLLLLYWIEEGTTIGSRDRKWLHASSLDHGRDFTIMILEHESIETHFEILT